MKNLISLITLLTVSLIGFAQVAPNKYWVKFADKTNTPYSIDNPEEFLSQKAIDRRSTHSIPIVQNDLPVDPAYIAFVVNTGATLLNVSKWFNSVTVLTEDSLVIAAIEELPFVL